MGFCTPHEYQRFLHQCPIFERLLTEDGILLRKYWFSVSDAEQERRFRSRLEDPMRRWKLSPMDLESISRWEEYSRAKDEMLVHTDIPEAPWYDVDSDDKRRARINMISHLLSTVPYQEVPASVHRSGEQLYVLTAAPWRLNFRGGTTVEVTLDGTTTVMHGELEEDPRATAETYVGRIAELGVKRAQRDIGLKIHVPRTP